MSSPGKRSEVVPNENASEPRIKRNFLSKEVNLMLCMLLTLAQFPTLHRAPQVPPRIIPEHSTRDYPDHLSDMVPIPPKEGNFIFSNSKKKSRTQHCSKKEQAEDQQMLTQMIL